MSLMMPLYSDWTFHILLGVSVAALAVAAYRAWSLRRWTRAPAGVGHEAVLALDLVDSTQLANQYGDALAMRARNFLQQAVRSAGRSCGMTHSEYTGDGCMLTFPSVLAATRAAKAIVRRLDERPAELQSLPPLAVRAAVAYGAILLDGGGRRHGATINRAFRLMNVPSDAFVAVAGEPALEVIPDRDRIFLDEASVQELPPGKVAFREVGVCSLKGFTGFHRAFEVHDVQAIHLTTEVS